MKAYSVNDTVTGAQSVNPSTYSDSSFWAKVRRFAKKAGAKVIYLALQLYYALQSDATPAWAKRVILGALAYFISPVDVIPDVTPIVGFSDDLATMAGALLTIKAHVTPDIKQSARRKLEDWFGKVDDSELR